VQFRTGDRVNHYTLIEPLGEGGQGTVWKVIDPRDGGVVRALKLVSLFGAGPAVFERVVREARILASSKHPALVTCHSFFEEPREGVVGLLMDLVPGRSLADAIETRGLDRGQSIALLGQVAEALAYLHGKGLVHRDLKPANLVLTDDFWEQPTRAGAVKLVDFGIAASADNAAQLTTPGTVIGTLPYLAPELVDPASWGKLAGPQRDVFALGVLACQLLTYRHPTGLGFDAGMIDFARAYKAAEAGRIVWPPSDVDGSWGVTMSACLALRAAERPADGAAVLALLRDRVISSHAPRRGGSAPTSVHRPLAYEATSIAPQPTSTRTAPMVAPPPGPARTIEAGPLHESRSPAPAQPLRKLWAVLLVVAGAIGGVVLFSLLRGSPDETPLIPLPTAMATATPTPTFVTAPVEAPLNPCRRSTMQFNPSATRFDCPVCVGEPGPVPARSWQMRFSGVSPPSRGTTVCAGFKGRTSVCAPFSRLPDLTGAAGRLPVTTADLESGSIYFKITDGTTTLAEGYGRRRGMTRYLETALCSGFVLLIDDPGSPTTVSVFLDPF
jgi:serine/threonine-protein kinase